MAARPFWIGTYKASGGKGLVSAVLDEKGVIHLGEPDERIVDASYAAWSEHAQTAWFVCEQENGSVSAWHRQDGSWIPRGHCETGGKAPCYLSLSPDRAILAVANYASGSVALIRVDPHGGSPLGQAGLLQDSGHGPDPDRQEGPHVHCTQFSGARSLYFCNLGTDRIVALSMDEQGAPGAPRPAFAAPPGFGPRHLIRGPRPMLWIANGELASELVLLEQRGHDLVSMCRTATDPSDTPENLGGHLMLDGDRVWTSNRGADTLAAFRVERYSLEPAATFPSGGRSPRHFARVGRYFIVAHEKDGAVACVDPDSGQIACSASVPGAAFVFVGPRA